ncbi:MAG: hypothetical protein JXM73_10220 [Anaerolineae bacterium]|nr:hypothetical protein [Anaerolineae bacterium]
MTLLWLALGALVGGIHGWTQRWTVARLQPDAIRLSLALVLAGAVVRWLLAAGLLLTALLQGIGAAVVALAGMMVARWALVWWWNRCEWGPTGPIVEG